jgi:C1A family cysteine protease
MEDLTEVRAALEEEEATEVHHAEVVEDTSVPTHSSAGRVYLTKQQIAAHRTARAKLSVHPKLAVPAPATRPAQLDLKAKCPFVYDQGDIGSCTANAICMALLMLEANKAFLPSRLYLYYKERLKELLPGEKISDSGADAADGLAILLTQGVCPEANWPYITTNCDVAPPAICDAEALQHKIHQIGTVAAPGVTGVALVNAIAHSIQLGIPVMIGIEVYSSFESAATTATGNVSMPSWRDYYLGGHEVLIVGYNDTTQRFLLINSWGKSWGQQGFFTLPYAYVTSPNLTSEFICITTV